VFLIAQREHATPANRIGVYVGGLDEIHVKATLVGRVTLVIKFKFDLLGFNPVITRDATRVTVGHILKSKLGGKIICGVSIRKDFPAKSPLEVKSRFGIQFT